jgi:hypothetical protein
MYIKRNTTKKLCEAIQNKAIYEMSVFKYKIAKFTMCQT